MQNSSAKQDLVDRLRIQVRSSNPSASFAIRGATVTAIPNGWSFITNPVPIPAPQVVRTDSSSNLEEHLQVITTIPPQSTDADDKLSVPFAPAAEENPSVPLAAVAEDKPSTTPAPRHKNKFPKADWTVDEKLILVRHWVKHGKSVTLLFESGNLPNEHLKL